MIKPQPLVFVPLVALYALLTLGWRSAMKVCLGLIGVTLIVCAPFLAPPHPELLVFFHNITLFLPLVSSNAFNLWFLINPALLARDPIIGPLSATPIGWLLFLPVYGLAAALMWRLRSLASLSMAMALAAIGFFELTTLQHERYLFQALAFLLLAAVCSRPFLRYYTVASLTVFSNMLAACALEGYAAAPFKDAWLDPLFPLFWRPPAIIFVTLALNLALLVAVIGTCIAYLHRPPAGHGEGRAADTTQSQERTGLLTTRAPLTFSLLGDGSHRLSEGCGSRAT